MLVAIANPLNLAIVGNPKRRKMAKAKKRTSKRSSKVSRSRSQLRYRWKKRTAAGGKFAGYKAIVLTKAGRKKKHAKPRGHRWAFSGHKGTVQLFKEGLLVATNPLAATLKQSIITPVMSLPKTVPALFKGKDMVKHVGTAAAGGIAGLVAGSFLQGLVLKVAGGVLPASVSAQLSKGIVQRIVGASFALIAGGAVAQFATKNKDTRAALITGTAAAALVEAIFPGRIAGHLSKLPYVGKLMTPVAVNASPVQGLAAIYGSDTLAGIGAYVDASAYQGVNGVGAYVDASAYQGVNGVGAYVDASAYQGVNGPMDDAVAGLNGGNLGYDPNQLAGGGHLNGLGAMGSNMMSHLDS